MCCVGVRGELLADLGRQGVDLVGQGGQHGQQGAGDVGLGGAVVAVAPRGAAVSRACSIGGVDPAAVADGGQPGRRRFGEASRPGPGVEAGQEGQADRGVDVGEQPDRAGKHVVQVGAQLVGHGHPVGDQVFAGPQVAPQREGGRRCRGSAARSRARSVRNVSASTNASNRSSLLPAEP